MYAVPVACEKILLLEDNPSDHEFIKDCLAERGWSGTSLDHADKLATACRFLSEREYALVIADLNLPDGEGLETFYKVKQMAPRSAIVVMTGMDDGNLAARAVRDGAQDYLIKGELPAERVLQSVTKALQRQSRFQAMAEKARILHKKNESLRDLAYLDPLSGLLNRRGLQKALRRRSPQAMARGLTALLIDVDDFKTVNDLFGYSQGDLVLRETARRVRELQRPQDLAARIGGDEFLLLLQAPLPGSLESLGEALRAAVARSRIAYDGGAFRVTVSIGIVSLPPSAASLGSILSACHQSLRDSKNSGKNCVRLGAPPTLESPVSAACLRRPFFDPLSGQVAGASFALPASGDNMDPMEALNSLMKAAAAEKAGMECHLHLSHAQLLQLDPERLTRDYGAARQDLKLRLAIPPVPLSPPPPGLIAAAWQLQAAGWPLALLGLRLDPHAWSNLLLLDPALVILDKSMVSATLNDPPRLRALVRAYRALSALGAYCVAEGVESEDERKIILGLGIPFVRGGALEGTLA